MRQGFECDQVGVLFMMGILFDCLNQYYWKSLTDAFSETILPRMHLADLLLPTLGGMRRFFENRSHGNFPVSFVPIWAEFETCLLEHAILRHTHAMGNANVYCDNVRPNTISHLISLTYSFLRSPATRKCHCMIPADVQAAKLQCTAPGAAKGLHG